MSTVITAQEAKPAQTQPKRYLLGWIAAIVCSIALLIAAWFGLMLYRMNYMPSDLDLSTTRLSNQGMYRVSYPPRHGPIVINQIHNWTNHIATPDGQPVTDAVITVDGDMPQHGHGLPTRPQVTKHLGNGDYLVEGMTLGDHPPRVMCVHPWCRYTGHIDRDASI